MTRYEIVNPSDPYTLEAVDVRVAAIVSVVLGGGQYALRPIDSKDAEQVPFFMFGGFDEWWDARCPDRPDAFLSANRQAVIACFDSVTLGSVERSSMNDIGRRAREHAAHLRAKGRPDPDSRAPQQVFTQCGPLPGEERSR